MHRLLASLLGRHPATRGEGEYDIFKYGKPRQQLIEFLEDQYSVGARLLHLSPIQLNGSFHRLYETTDGLQQCRLPTARWAQQNESVRRINIEADSVCRRHQMGIRPVLQRHTIDTKKGIGRNRQSRNSLVVRDPAGLPTGSLRP